VRGGDCDMGYQACAWVAGQGGCIAMAQSKKQVLKRIDRACRRLDPQVRYRAAQLRRPDLLDEFGLIWGETYQLLRDMQRFPGGTLQRAAHGLFPVTYQRVARLYERLHTFMQRLPSSR